MSHKSTFITLLSQTFLIYFVSAWCLKATISENDQVLAVDYSPDGSMVALGCKNKTIRIYDSLSLIFKYSFTVPAEPSSLKFNGANTLIVAASIHSDLKIYTLATGAITTLSTGQSEVNGVDFNSDSSRLVSCGKDHELKIWDTATWSSTPLNTWTNGGGAYEFLSCEFTSTGSILVGENTGYVRLYNSPYSNTNNVSNALFGGNQLSAVSNIYGSLNYIVAENNNKRLYDSPLNTTIIYSAGSKTLLTTAYARTLDYFVTGGNEKKVFFFNATGRNNSLIQSVAVYGEVVSSDFSNDGQYVIFGCTDNTGYIFQQFCLSCQSNSYFNSTTKQCQLCSIIEGCGSCYNGSVCALCSQGFYLTATKTCLACLNILGGCGVCTNSTYCTSPLPGFYLTATNVAATCSSAMPGCLICNSSLICLQCHNQYYLNSSNKCQACSSISYCLKCYNSTYCTQCQAGYYPLVAATTPPTSSCNRCATNCLDCQSPTICFECVVGYYTTGATCLACSTDCIACNNTNFCFDCAANYFITTTGTCTACTAPCLSCITTATTCLSCYPGSYFDGVNACVLCSGGCLTCTGAGSTACLSCQQGYYTSAANTCALCNSKFPNCQSCNSTNCITCLTSFYYDSAALPATQCKSCSSQMHGCILCSSATACLFCAPGHYLNSTQTANNSCQPCAVGCSTCENSTNCTSCVSGYYFASTTFTCPLCTSTCVTCKTSTFCLSCVIGYYNVPSTGVCTACNVTKANCLACLNNTATTIQCTECGVGFFLNSGSCSRCNPNCVTCNASSTCLSCQLGYYLNTTSYTCMTCSPTCAQCSVNGTCQSCHVGYYLSSFNCLACSSIGCLTCKPDLTCLSCITGYYLAGTNICSLCSSTLLNCLTCTSGTNCSQCTYGFTLVLSGTNYICSTCSVLTGCFHCSSNSICLACQSGYYLNSPSCSSCPEGCRNCNSSNYCLSCGSSYFNGNILGVANAGQCFKCQNYLSGCDICQNNTECITCMSGYYLDTTVVLKVCKLCEVNIPYCSTCNSSVICTSCKGGYHLATDTLSCIMCSTTFAACRLCNRLGTTCTDCQSGYYINAGNCLLCSNNLPGCQICNGSSTCLQCLSGYYLNSPNCNLCSSSIPGCIFCNSSSICLQCEGGYYLNSTFKCAPCQVVGCEVCIELAPTSCVTCNSLYYKSSSTSCSLCRTSISGCLTCLNSTDCSKCDVGYYLNGITNPPQCSLCSSVLSGCSICSSNLICLECKSMYFLNTLDQCQKCSSPMTGCTFCTNNTICLSCGSGFFLNSSGLCSSCTDLTGCLVCKDSAMCLFCNTGYYLNSFACSSCSIIQGCYSCISNTVCTSCKGGYTLNSNAGCDVAQVKADRQVTEIVLKTMYVNQTTLVHYMYTRNMNYTKVDINWMTEVRLFILSSSNTQINLTIIKAEWSTENDYTLIIYTNNPVDYDSLTKKMPFTRRLLSFSLDLNNTKTGIEITQAALQQILPNFQHSGSLLLDYNLNDAEFYYSFSKNYAPSDFPFYIIGAIFVGLLFLKYSVKSLITVPKSVNIGNIMPHILCFKVGALLLFPTYFEYINYCSGFMYADFPFLNRYFGAFLSDQRDQSPLAYKFFFDNMNLASMYLLGLSVFILFAIITIIIGKSLSPKYDYKMYSYLQFLYNFFCFGLIFAGCASLQGAILNPMETLSINGAFYILGILIYFCMLCECVYKISQDKVYNFYKVRVMIKATLLSLSHFSPIYLLSSAVLIDIILTIVEFKMSEYSKTYCKYWLFAHISCNLALILLVFLPIIKLTMVLVSSMLFLAIISQAIIHYQQTKQKNQDKFEIPGEKDEQNVWDLNMNEKQNQYKDDDINNKTRGSFLGNKDDHAQTMYSNINGNQMSNLQSRYKRHRGFKKTREQNKQKILTVEKSNFKNNDQHIQTSYKEQNLTFMIQDAKVSEN